MTELFVEQTRRSMYAGESATHCDECGEPIPEARRSAIACRYCLPCQTKLERSGKI
ncbi:TraR/DksA C4-type zinc finger protein [Methylomonas sp. UP202]